MTPFFSIIIPLYNKEKHIKSTIESVLAQTFQNFEIIVVNDGSTDNSEAVVNSIFDSRIRIFNIKNRGVSSARNYGIKKAISQLIVLLDADDYWLPWHLEDLKWLFETFPHCGLYAKAYAKRDEKHLYKLRFHKVPKIKNWHGVLDDFFESSLKACIAHSSSVMIPKSSFDKVGYFNENYNSGEDTDLWIRLAIDFPVAFYNKVSAYHQQHTTNRISQIALSSRMHFNPLAYEISAQNNPNLKKFLDLNKVSMALQFKLENQDLLVKKLMKSIDKNNCTPLQRLLLNSPKSMLQLAWELKKMALKVNINLRLFG